MNGIYLSSKNRKNRLLNGTQHVYMRSTYRRKKIHEFDTFLYRMGVGGLRLRNKDMLKQELNTVHLPIKTVKNVLQCYL